LNGNERRIVVKRFRDWSGVKWFPLTIWALGARSFAVQGRLRMERECAISELLRNEGFNVPKVLHVSHSKRLVYMEYIEGENFGTALKRIAESNETAKAVKDLATITRVGEIFARVHALNVALGDTKPENVIVDSANQVFILDFEQASRGGDAAWDIAEFLYYSGHYLPPIQNVGSSQEIAEAFIAGYLKAGGNSAVVRKAGAPKYTRVFSVFTMPSVIRTMSNTCKKTRAPEVDTHG
jgi:tRNA A-37 threonylcarbamoyl transferase component Bud32